MITYRGVDKHGNNRTGRVEKRAAFFAEEKFTAGWRELTILDRTGQIVGGITLDYRLNRTWWANS